MADERSGEVGAGDAAKAILGRIDLMRIRSMEPTACPACDKPVMVGEVYAGKCGECRAKERRREHFRHAVRELPELFQSAAWKNIPGKERTKAALVDGVIRRKGLYLYGTNGNFKTTMLACAYKTAARELPPMPNDEFPPVKWIVWPEFLNILRETYRTDQSDLRLLYELITAAKRGILFVDELGGEQVKRGSDQAEVSWVEEKAYLLFDAIYRGKGCVFITSNLALGEHVHKLGPRVVSRLSEICVQAEITGPDVRLNAAHGG